MNDAIEFWKFLPLNTKYAVSNLGRVKRIALSRGKVPNGCLKPCINRDGYALVHLSDKSYSVHKLVMVTFVGDYPKGME